MPGQQAVLVIGCDFEERTLDARDQEDLAAARFEMVTSWNYKAKPNTWMGCPVPKRLGIPLAMKIINRSQRYENEQLAILMLVDENTGFAPMDFQQNGVGMVLMARTDGKDLTVGEVLQLNDYLNDLMDLYPDLDLTKARDKKRLDDALNPQRYARFTNA